MAKGKSKRLKRRIPVKLAPSRYERALRRLHKEHTKMLKRQMRPLRPHL